MPAIKSAKNSRKLNQFTFHGTYESGVTGSMKASINIETSGELRLFTELPAYIVASGVGSLRDKRSTHIADGRLYGREPEEIKQGVQALHNAYRNLLIEQQREKVIAVAFQARIPGDHANNSRSDFSFVNHELVIAMDIDIFWRSNGQLYAFDGDDNDRTMRMAGGSTRVEYRFIPYTDEAWAALQAVQKQLSDGTKRLRDILRKDDLPKLLQSGGLKLLT